MNQELLDVQAGFRKGRTREQIANMLWHRKKKGIPKKICFIDYAEAFDCVDHKYSVEYSEEMGIPDHFICLLETCMQDEKQHFELYMEQRPGSKLGKQMSRLYIVTLIT